MVFDCIGLPGSEVQSALSPEYWVLHNRITYLSMNQCKQYCGY